VAAFATQLSWTTLSGRCQQGDHAIRRAQPAYPPRKQGKPAQVSSIEKLDYSTLEHAGQANRRGMKR
jgi:hypothetical protein